MKSAVRDLRADVRRASNEVRRDERRASRESRETARIARETVRAAREGAREGRYVAREAARAARDAAREASTEIRTVWRSLQADLDGFVSDVVSAARRHDLDKARLASLRTALHEARAAILEALEGNHKEE